jgi:hypothetical protein
VLILGLHRLGPLHLRRALTIVFKLAAHAGRLPQQRIILDGPAVVVNPGSAKSPPEPGFTFRWFESGSPGPLRRGRVISMRGGLRDPTSHWVKEVAAPKSGQLRLAHGAVSSTAPST